MYIICILTKMNFFSKIVSKIFNMTLYLNNVFTQNAFISMITTKSFKIVQICRSMWRTKPWVTLLEICTKAYSRSFHYGIIQMAEKNLREAMPIFFLSVEIARILLPIHPFSVWELHDYIYFLTLSIKSYCRK